MANAIGNVNRTRIDAARSRLRLEDGERLYPKNRSGSTLLQGFAREVAAWMGYVDPKHQAGKLIQQITKGTPRATEAWTDSPQATDDKYVELDYELAVALADATEGAARSTVLKVIQVEPSHRFVAWQALVDGYAPKSSNDPASVLQPIFATLKRYNDAKELKERLTARSSKVAGYEHQFKAIGEAQKTFVVREMMPKDIKLKFLTGPRGFDEIMEKLDIIINEMMADDGPVPMDLGHSGTHDAKTIQSDQDTSNDTSYDDVCAITWKGYKAGTGAGKEGPNGPGRWHRGGGDDEWMSGRRDDGGKKGGKKGSKTSCGALGGRRRLNSQGRNEAVQSVLEQQHCRSGEMQRLPGPENARDEHRRRLDKRESDVASPAAEKADVEAEPAPAQLREIFRCLAFLRRAISGTREEACMNSLLKCSRDMT